MAVAASRRKKLLTCLHLMVPGIQEQGICQPEPPRSSHELKATLAVPTRFEGRGLISAAYAGGTSHRAQGFHRWQSRNHAGHPEKLSVWHRLQPSGSLPPFPRTFAVEPHHPWLHEKPRWAGGDNGKPGLAHPLHRLEQLPRTDPAAPSPKSRSRSHPC